MHEASHISLNGLRGASHDSWDAYSNQSQLRYAQGLANAARLTFLGSEGANAARVDAYVFQFLYRAIILLKEAFDEKGFYN